MRSRPAVLLVMVASVSLGVRAQPQSRLFGLDDFARVTRLADPQIAPDGRSIAIVVSRANLEEDRWESELALVDVESGRTRPLTSERRSASQPRWAPTGDRVAFLATAGTGREAHPQVFVLTMGGGDARRITNAPEGVQQFAWSPDGATIAFATADEPDKKTGVERFNDSFEIGNDDFLVTAAPLPTHLWLVPSDGGPARRLTSGSWSLPVTFPPGSPSSPIAWAPDGKSIAIAKVVSPHSGDRSQSSIALVDASTGALRPLTGVARGEGYPVFSPDGTGIAYWYPRDGDGSNVSEVHLAPASGAAGRSLTRALDRNIARAIWLPDGRSLLVGANDGSRVSLWIQPVDGQAQRLALGSVSPASAFWVDVNVGRNGSIAFVGSDVTHPAELYYMTTPAAAPRRLTDVNHEIASLPLARTEVVEWQAEGFAQNGLLTYPTQFAPGQKYPLVLVIHGGPRAASLETFSAQAQLFAARGWMVFQPNYRGSDQLGNAYQRAIRNDAGDGPGRDVMAGLAAVKKRGFIDDSRIAVSGWSYGGYMTTWLLGHYQGWRVAVAGAAVTDNVDQYNLGDANVGRANAFGGSPWTGTLMDAYREQSPITYVQKMRAPTLVLSDTGDYRVTITQSYKLYHALKDNGVETRFFAYPVRGHSPQDPVRQRDVQRRWMEWIDQHFSERRTTSQ
jgi:dipeptidyl aminopeptidase/acylaminoacyl peptidase